MANTTHLHQIVTAQKQGQPKGIYSICSYNKYVMEAAFQQAQEDQSVVLIESTCNQVNQFGGYTGMTPADFREYIVSIARSANFPVERLILGGDHLGPFPFQTEPGEIALEKSREMVKQYVLAGCSKIHLDTSMRLADDPGEAGALLDPGRIAERCAQLCAVAEEAFARLQEQHPADSAPVYVIGTEVPTPGGSDEVEEGLSVTRPEDFRQTVSITREAFARHNLHDAWDRVIAVVVQPGVEHGDHTIHEYNREEARELTEALKAFPQLVFEGHSTDNQTPAGLQAMVEDGIAILKVGPCLTFAAREAIFMLNYMEEELLQHKPHVQLSRFRDTLDQVMQQQPQYWQNYYQGDEHEVAFARKYSFFDRVRYYWVNQHVQDALDRLIHNLRATDIPLSLISQFLPEQYKKLRNGLLEKDPEVFIRDKIRDVLKIYAYAAGDRDTI
ncbi:tagatose-bisphosphate aldolase [candidate division KSB3 bacterium]|uniref:Tagatose-bisphosphate aldolase n=1 Tax=candidate division KSB3 bacterium TaxID=2044937 RepID=A0A9D5K040_9BACT|nr:tagatose-bisphosphate aldolase [candidate division KSB3 bacterium]MBD3327413.1 tagatose-bisphosphate aldolase [candidate division KSB3 bacterium]